MQQLKVTLGKEVRDFRTRSGLSQEQLAEKLGVSREAVSKIERGHTKRPSDDILDGLERVLGLSRNRSYQLIGQLDYEGTVEPGAVLVQIAALPTHQERLAAWGELPETIRFAVTKLMQDLLLDTSMRLAESTGQLPPDPSATGSD